MKKITLGAKYMLRHTSDILELLLNHDLEPYVYTEKGLTLYPGVKKSDVNIFLASCFINVYREIFILVPESKLLEIKLSLP